MLLYNISIVIEDRSHDAVYAWLLSELRSDPCQAKFLKMLDSPHAGTTYCVQLVAEDERILAGFQGGFRQRLQDYITREHAGSTFVFDSKMAYVDLG